MGCAIGKIRCGRAENTGHSDVGTENGRQEQCPNIRCPIGIMLAHGVFYHAVQHSNTFFYQYLAAAGTLLQVAAQHNTGNTKQQHNRKRRNRCLRDGNSTKQRDREINLRPVHGTASPPLESLRKNSISLMAACANSNGNNAASGSQTLAWNSRT